jgi:hypothetical protein
VTSASTRLALGCTLLFAACSDPPKPAPKLCFLERPNSSGGAAPVRTHEWLKLIVKPKAQNRDVIGEHDCTGAEIRYEPPPSDCLVKAPLLTAPEPVPLTEESVFERRLQGEQRLVWVATHRFANGDGFGPVALARILATGIEVEAIGNLRLRRERVDLDLWTIEGRKVLVAHGETCMKRRDPSSCHRAANVLIELDKAFLHPVISYKSGRCIDEPWVELKRSEDLPLENGWNRHFEITSSLTRDLRYVVITEQVRVQDSDPDAPDIPPREVRRIDTERFLHVEGPLLVTRQHPLWPRILPSAGSTELIR